MRDSDYWIYITITQINVFFKVTIMENCLITKLKGVVDNDNLLRLGELVMTTNSVMTANRKFTIDTTGSGIISKKILTPGYSFVDAQGVSIGAESDADAVYLPYDTPVGVKVSIIPKYNITTIATVGFSYDIRNAFFKETLILFSFNAQWEESKFEPRLIGKLSDFIRYSNLATIDIAHGHSFVADIETIGDLQNCNYARVLLNNVIQGDLVNIVKKRVSRFNQLTGNIDMGMFNSSFSDAKNMMFNGNAVVGDHTNSHLTWSTEGTTVTVNYTSSDKPALTTTFELN